MQGIAASWTPAGDLATVSYSDDTPDVTRTYRRDGSLATVTDAAGTTTYGYNGTLASGESIQGVRSMASPSPIRSPWAADKALPPPLAAIPYP